MWLARARVRDVQRPLIRRERAPVWGPHLCDPFRRWIFIRGAQLALDCAGPVKLECTIDADAAHPSGLIAVPSRSGDLHRDEAREVAEVLTLLTPDPDQIQLLEHARRDSFDL